jgi:hypothetical protein
MSFDTVLLNSIRQSRVTVTGVLDVTNFGTLSRVTEALDEYTFRHGRFTISVQGRSEQIFSAVGIFHSISRPFSRFLASNQPQISQISWIRASSTVKNAFSFIAQKLVEINCSDHS